MAAVFDLYWPDGRLQMDLTARIPKVLRQVTIYGQPGDNQITVLPIPEWDDPAVIGWFVPDYGWTSTTIYQGILHKEGSNLVYAFRSSRWPNGIICTIGVM